MAAADFDSGWHGCHNINPQWSSRQPLANNIRSHADLMPDNQDLGAAADAYDHAHAAWLDWQTQLGADSPDNAWDDSTRRRLGAEAVFRAYEAETRAIEALKRALAAS